MDKPNYLKNYRPILFYFRDAYNLKVSDKVAKGSKDEIESECLYMHAIEMFTNIEGGKKNAN